MSPCPFPGSLKRVNSWVTGDVISKSRRQMSTLRNASQSSDSKCAMLRSSSAKGRILKLRRRTGWIPRRVVDSSCEMRMANTNKPGSLTQQQQNNRQRQQTVQWYGESISYVQLVLRRLLFRSSNTRNVTSGTAAAQHATWRWFTALLWCVAIFEPTDSVSNIWPWPHPPRDLGLPACLDIGRVRSLKNSIRS